MSKANRDLFSEVAVGIFMLAVLSLLVYFTVIISGVDILRGQRSRTICVSFDSVGGLKTRDSVMYRGTKVGLVDRIEITSSNLLVYAEIDDAVVLREKYNVSVCNLSMLGGNYMLLEEGIGNLVDLDSGKILKGVPPSDWMRDISSVAKNLNELTSRDELRAIITNIADVTFQVKNLISRLERGEGTLGKLMSSDATIYDDLKVAVSNACVASENVVAVTDNLKKSNLIEDIESAVDSFNKSAKSLNFEESVKRAEELLSNLNEVALRLKNGEGTLGKLSKDAKLYDEVDGVIKDVRQVIDNYRDTTPISTFGSLIMGGL